MHAVGRAQVFSALIRQPVSFFDVEEVGALTSRLGSDCQAVVRALATNFNVAVRNLMQCIGEQIPPVVMYIAERAKRATSGNTFCALADHTSTVYNLNHHIEHDLALPLNHYGIVSI